MKQLQTQIKEAAVLLLIHHPLLFLFLFFLKFQNFQLSKSHNPLMMMNNLEEETQKKENVERGEGKCGMWRWRWRKDLGWEGKFYYLFCRNQSGRDLSEREWTAKMMMLFFRLN